MVAARTEMRNYLRGVIGIADVTGDLHARRDAVRNKGLETMADLAEFKESDIKILCSSVQKPGGTIEDPNDATRRIPNPGFNILEIAEKMLKLACYGANIYNMLGRVIDSDSLLRICLCEF